MALEKLSEVTKSNYYNNVGEYLISYDVMGDATQGVSTIMAVVKKGDARYGYVSVKADGSKNCSFEVEVTDADAKSIFTTAIDDAAQIIAEYKK